MIDSERRPDIEFEVIKNELTQDLSELTEQTHGIGKKQRKLRKVEALSATWDLSEKLTEKRIDASWIGAMENEGIARKTAVRIFRARQAIEQQLHNIPETPPK